MRKLKDELKAEKAENARLTTKMKKCIDDAALKKAKSGIAKMDSWSDKAKAAAKKANDEIALQATKSGKGKGEKGQSHKKAPSKASKQEEICDLMVEQCKKEPTDAKCQKCKEEKEFKKLQGAEKHARTRGWLYYLSPERITKVFSNVTTETEKNLKASVPISDFKCPSWVESSAYAEASWIQLRGNCAGEILASGDKNPLHNAATPCSMCIMGGTEAVCMQVNKRESKHPGKNKWLFNNYDSSITLEKHSKTASSSLGESVLKTSRTEGRMNYKEDMGIVGRNRVVGMLALGATVGTDSHQLAPEGCLISFMHGYKAVGMSGLYPLAHYKKTKTATPEGRGRRLLAKRRKKSQDDDRRRKSSSSDDRRRISSSSDDRRRKSSSSDDRRRKSSSSDDRRRRARRTTIVKKIVKEFKSRFKSRCKFMGEQDKLCFCGYYSSADTPLAALAEQTYGKPRGGCTRASYSKSTTCKACMDTEKSQMTLKSQREKETDGLKQMEANEFVAEKTGWKGVDINTDHPETTGKLHVEYIKINICVSKDKVTTPPAPPGSATAQESGAEKATKETDISLLETAEKAGRRRKKSSSNDRRRRSSSSSDRRRRSSSSSDRRRRSSSSSDRRRRSSSSSNDRRRRTSSSSNDRRRRQSVQGVTGVKGVSWSQSNEKFEKKRATYNVMSEAGLKNVWDVLVANRTHQGSVMNRVVVALDKTREDKGLVKSYPNLRCVVKKIILRTKIVVGSNKKMVKKKSSSDDSRTSSDDRRRKTSSSSRRRRRRKKEELGEDGGLRQAKGKKSGQIGITRQAINSFSLLAKRKAAAWSNKAKAAAKEADDAIAIQARKSGIGNMDKWSDEAKAAAKEANDAIADQARQSFYGELTRLRAEVIANDFATEAKLLAAMVV